MPRSATAVAENEVSMLEFDKNSFAQLVQAQPGIAIKLLKLFASRIYDQKRKLKIMNMPDNESKVLDVFLMLAERMNIDSENTREVDFEIDAVEVANWAGISLKDCDATLANLEKGGRLVVRDKSVKVNNLYQVSRYVLSKQKSVEQNV
ncbi:MAG: hypothetical protein GF311_27520 [Candidatus Lokiarchaeota archaeon]|nr:hypothetical protein [Candidatus Lokiarchaeota archaeon]